MHLAIPNWLFNNGIGQHGSTNTNYIHKIYPIESPEPKQAHTHTIHTRKSTKLFICHFIVVSEKHQKIALATIRQSILRIFN